MFAEENLPIGEIARLRGVSENTIYGHLLKVYQMGLDVDLNEFISEEEIKQIQQAKIQLKSPDTLKPYFEHFEEAMPYWKIKFGLYLG